MSITLILVAIIAGLIFSMGMLTGAYLIILNKLKKKILDLKCDRGVFVPRKTMMNATEHHCFNLLKQMFADLPYEVFSQVAMASLIRISDKAVDYYDSLEDLDKSIDFVVTDSKTMKPLLAIELDGPDHNKDSRKIRDQFLKRIFTDCGFPFLSIPVIALSNEEDFKQKIFSILYKSDSIDSRNPEVPAANSSNLQ
jgi:hypothetical protein